MLVMMPTRSAVHMQWWGATVSQEHKEAETSAVSHWDLLCALGMSFASPLHYMGPAAERVRCDEPVGLRRYDEYGSFAAETVRVDFITQSALRSALLFSPTCMQTSRSSHPASTLGSGSSLVSWPLDTGTGPRAIRPMTARSRELLAVDALKVLMTGPLQGACGT